ncbi:hypothetical protein [Victivallis sp. Marseille-Q1083]|uniref:type IV toxin-antitoxin system AbiEi family antitoxin domain-containing protein n=1 Tax=Victivallis sp. Marseille-Q1083 TaxID=2717288 RepID=UPI0015896C55|nr:hypothetical protein [Victivallis sp. Marseille-Q1083]
MKIKLRQKIEEDVFDYVQLTSVLAGYGNIRAKIGRLLASGEIIRLKKGLYTFPEYLRKAPLNSCVVANMLYGPSYVSCDYALSYYGMIPEKVQLVTSMTAGRSCEFETPIGSFVYFSRQAQDYSIGIESGNSGNCNFLIASREKAIYDKALTDKRFTGNDIMAYCLDDLRLEDEALHRLNCEVFMALQAVARGKLAKLVNFLLEINQ